jgi:pyridoxamine 5'-phosphate oxidase
MNRDIASIRRDYQLASLEEETCGALPMDQFERWWEEAIASNIDEVNAFVLSTIKASGVPSARVVLLKGYTPEGFIFFTNYESAKGQDIEQHPKVAMNFFWKELERQVRITGTIEKVSTEESEKYFKSRPKESQIGAWSSPQSRIIPDRAFLEEIVAENAEKFKEGEIPLPPHWGGYIVKPFEMEFWQGRSSRLHDRIQYSLHSDGHWVRVRLAP